MKNAEIRQNLEREILKLKAQKKPLEKNDSDEYLRCLKRLFALNRIYALRQDKICTCTYGSLGDFLAEFVGFTAPLLTVQGKRIMLDFVRHSRTSVFFSPRLTEIALGCMMCEFLKNSDDMRLSILPTSYGMAICATGKHANLTGLSVACIRHISHLHAGQIIINHSKKSEQILLSFPYLPRFKALKLVPCATELCRLCHI